MNVFVTIGLATAMLFMTGCASWAPVPVVHPVAKSGGGGYDLPTSGQPEYPGRMANLIQLVHAYTVVWSTQRDKLATELNQANNGLLVGGLTAVFAGLRKSTEGARIGAIIGGASGLLPDHFKITNQRDNYRQAAQMMSCIEDELSSVPQAYWDVFFEDSGAYRGPFTTDGYKSVATIRDTTIATMSKIIKKLGDSQGQLVFTTPDQAALKQAFGKYSEEKAKADTESKNTSKQLKINTAARKWAIQQPGTTDFLLFGVTKDAVPASAFEDINEYELSLIHI